MKTIWIIYPYGNIGEEKFLYVRQVRFGKMLSEHGYRVIYWTANFSHTFKTMRSESWKTINVCENFDIELVPSSSYEKNISLGRAKFEINYSKSLAKKFKELDCPDLIITSGTGLMTAFYPVWPYVKEHSITTIYDIMDVHMFNSYMEQHHKGLVPLAKLVTNNIERKEQPFFEYIHAVCGLGRNQLEIAKKKTGKKDIPSCLVYNSIVVEEFRKKMELDCQVELPVKNNDEIWCVYAGSLGPSYDIETIIKCADIVKKNNNKIKFIIAGAGPQEKLVEEAGEQNDNIAYLGSLNPDWLPAIYKQCDIGLCTYASYSTVDMPDKFYDYTAAGLAIVNSLQGEIKEYVSEAGLQYTAENVESFYEAIIKISTDIENYKSKSFELAEKFDFNKQLSGLLKMINSLTGESSEQVE